MSGFFIIMHPSVHMCKLSQVLKVCNTHTRGKQNKTKQDLPTSTDKFII